MRGGHAEIGALRLPLPASAARGAVADGTAATLAIRPEFLALGAHGPVVTPDLPAISHEPLGAETSLVLDFHGAPLRLRVPGLHHVAPGARHAVTWDMAGAHLFDAGTGAPPVRPNIVLITADQLRPYELGCYGGDVATPNVDRLAARGAVWETAITNFPVCMAARSVLISGQHNRTATGGRTNVAWPGRPGDFTCPNTPIRAAPTCPTRRWPRSCATRATPRP